jgi:hypothetical protein
MFLVVFAHRSQKQPLFTVAQASSANRTRNIHAPSVLPLAEQQPRIVVVDGEMPVAGSNGHMDMFQIRWLFDTLPCDKNAALSFTGRIVGAITSMTEATKQRGLRIRLSCGG